MTREEAMALAAKYGPREDFTDTPEHIMDPKHGIILLNDEYFVWDNVTNDFVSIEN